jgi:pimeloyl-ACP methyl ester carboxylesterase
MRELVVQIDAGSPLVGILTEPDERTTLPAILVLNAGLVHRVGVSRLYVKLARTLAASGFTVLRFDSSGIGDSPPRPDHLPVAQSSLEEPRRVMDWFTRRSGVDRFALVGHCSGASNSFRVASVDPRVVGALMVNIEPVNQEWQDYDFRRKRTQYFTRYYTERLGDMNQWKRVLSGKANYRKLVETATQTVFLNRLAFLKTRYRKPTLSVEDSRFAAELAAAEPNLRSLVGRGVRPWFLFPEGSTGYEFVRALFGPTLDELRAAGQLHLQLIPHCDHLFTRLATQAELLQTAEAWGNELRSMAR